MPQATPATATAPAPFAFTGNKFEFRAVGSSQSIAGPQVVLNTIVAESLDEVATRLEAAVAAGRPLNAEVQAMLQAMIAGSKKVIFNGDGYSSAWHAEAESRGLPNRRNTVDSLPDLVSAKSVELFGKYKVFNSRELHSRYEILLENYIKTIHIEAGPTSQIATKQILPAALRYQHEIAQTLASLIKVGGESSIQRGLLIEVSRTVDELYTAIGRLNAAYDHHAEGDSLSHAKHMRDAVVPAMLAVRASGDKLETLVADDLWPLPTYQEMLFIK